MRQTVHMQKKTICLLYSCKQEHMLQFRKESFTGQATRTLKKLLIRCVLISDQVCVCRKVLTISVCSCLQIGLNIRFPFSVSEHGRSFQPNVPVVGRILNSTQSSLLPLLFGLLGNQFMNNRLSPDNHWKRPSQEQRVTLTLITTSVTYKRCKKTL